MYEEEDDVNEERDGHALSVSHRAVGEKVANEVRLRLLGPDDRAEEGGVKDLSELKDRDRDDQHERDAGDPVKKEAADEGLGE